MEELDARIGSLAYLHKAGDIIPAIYKVEATPDSQPFSYPTECPVCGKPLDGEACINLDCPQKNEVRLYHWVSKEGIDVKGVSKNLVAQLIEKGLIRTVPDFYKLTVPNLYHVPKMGPTKIKNVRTALAESTSVSFSKVLSGLCIKNLGGKSAEQLAAASANSWDNLLNMPESSIAAVVGAAKAKTIYAELHSEYIKTLIDEFRTLNIFTF